MLFRSGELAVSVLFLGRTVAGHFAAERSFAADLGLAAQVMFALFPLVQAGRRPEGPANF